MDRIYGADCIGRGSRIHQGAVIIGSTDMKRSCMQANETIIPVIDIEAAYRFVVRLGYENAAWVGGCSFTVTIVDHTGDLHCVRITEIEKSNLG